MLKNNITYLSILSQRFSTFILHITLPICRVMIKFLAKFRIILYVLAAYFNNLHEHGKLICQKLALHMPAHV